MMPEIKQKTWKVPFPPQCKIEGCSTDKHKITLDDKEQDDDDPDVADEREWRRIQRNIKKLIMFIVSRI